MESFTKLFGSLLVFVYHCFDRIVINGYLEHLSRPGQVVHFFREILGVRAITKEALGRRTTEYLSSAIIQSVVMPPPFAGRIRGASRPKLVSRRREIRRVACAYGHWPERWLAGAPGFQALTRNEDGPDCSG